MLQLALNAIVLVLDAIPTMVLNVIVVMMDFSLIKLNVQLANQLVPSVLLQLFAICARMVLLLSKLLFNKQARLELCRLL